MHIDAQMFNCLNSLAPDYLSILFEYLSLHHGVNIRVVTNKDLKIPRSRTSAGEQSFGVRGALSWNKLPQDIKEATMVKSFVARLTKLREQKYDFDND